MGTQNQTKAPVLRYYKPDRLEKRSTPLTRGESTERMKSDDKNSTLISFFVRWAGFAIIGLLLFINFTTTQPGVKFVDYDEVYQSQDSYRSGIAEIYEQSWTNKGKLTMQTADFERSIKNKFPEVDGATVVVPLVGRQVQVGMSFVDPLGRLQASAGQQGIIGTNGSLLTLESSEQINARYAHLPIISLPNMPYEKGQSLLTNDEVELIMLLRTELDGSEPFRYQLKSIEYDVKKRDILVRFFSVPYYAKLTPERTARDQVGALVATLRYALEQGIQPQEYVDVRVDDRTFVR